MSALGTQGRRRRSGTTTDPVARPAAADRVTRARRDRPPLRARSRPTPVDRMLQGQPSRRRGFRCPRPILGGEDRPNIGRVQPSIPHLDQRPNHDPDHLVQEGVRSEPEDDQVRLASDGEPLKVARRRAPTTRMATETREVVRADEDRGGPAHRADVERPGPVPCVPARERVGRSRRIDGVPVRTGGSGEPSVESFPHLSHIADGDLGREPPVQEVSYLCRPSWRSRDEGGDLSPRVHASVGTPRDRQRDRLPQQLLERSGELTLNGSDRGIALRRPPTEPGAVVREV